MSTLNKNVSLLPRALVVDDCPAQRLLLSHMLSQLDYEVTAAENGKEAVKLFNPEQTDVVFMDIEMPIMSGIEAAGIIRQTMGERFIPIIFLTGGDTDIYLDKCSKVGDDFIKKPFNANILSSKTRSLLRIKQLYQEQLRQKKEIEAFKALQDKEHDAAADVYDRIVGAGYMHSPNLHSALSPMSKFNGDILLCAYTPADKLNVLLGDFTGHGITASLASAPAAEIFYGMTAKGFGIREITEEINLKLKRLLPVDMFLAATIVCLDRENHNLSVITCGLPEHFLFCKETGDIQTVTSNNLPLGIVDSSDLNLIEKHYRVTSSQRLIMFTDGVIEAENYDGVPFGFDGVKKCLKPRQESCFNDILHTLGSHQGELAQQDDITLVRLSCDFTPEKWNLYLNNDKQVQIEASNWSSSSTLCHNTLKRFDPVPTLVNSLMDLQGLVPFKESIFLIITELFINSLEHGLLGLDSSLKSNPDRFMDFFELKQQRLDQLTEGHITLTFSHIPYEKGGKLTIQIQDSGDGFDDQSISSNLTDNQQYSGRGLSLIRQICDSLEYSNGGREATATFIWQND